MDKDTRYIIFLSITVGFILISQMSMPNLILLGIFLLLGIYGFVLLIFFVQNRNNNNKTQYSKVPVETLLQ